MIILDTSALIDPPRQLEDDVYGVSMLSVAELQFGIHSAATPGLRAKRIAILQGYRQTLDWLAFDERSAESYGVLAARVGQTRQGHARSKDVLIAAQAHALGAKLVTRNFRDFELITDLVEIEVLP